MTQKQEEYILDLIDPYTNPYSDTLKQDKKKVMDILDFYNVDYNYVGKRYSFGGAVAKIVIIVYEYDTATGDLNGHELDTSEF